MEAIVAPIPSWDDFPQDFREMFRGFRTPDVGWDMLERISLGRSDRIAAMSKVVAWVPQDLPCRRALRKIDFHLKSGELTGTNVAKRWRQDLLDVTGAWP